MILTRRTTLATYRPHKATNRPFLDINLPRAVCENPVLCSTHLHSRMPPTTSSHKRHLAADVLIAVDSCCCSILYAVAELSYFALRPEAIQIVMKVSIWCAKMISKHIRSLKVGSNSGDLGKRSPLNHSYEIPAFQQPFYLVLSGAVHK